MKASQDRVPFKALNHTFDLSNHRPTQISPKAKKLMPSIIRLAKLMEIADPSKSTAYYIKQYKVESTIKA
ncbi:MAG: hypothetical protein ACPGWR_02460 [Ardenticatenaceae bacterium]